MQTSFMGYRLQELFDPVQTHALYGVPVEQVDDVKDELRKKFGATRFRLVTAYNKSKIICFKTKK